MSEPESRPRLTARSIVRWRRASMRIRLITIAITATGMTLLLLGAAWWQTGPFNESRVTGKTTEPTTIQTSPTAPVYDGTRYCIEYRRMMRKKTICRDYFRSPGTADAKALELVSPTAVCWGNAKIGRRLPDCWW